MDIIKVNCLNKTLGIAKGLRFSVLENGECIGNILEVVDIVDNNTSIKLYSEMLKMDIPQKFKISELINNIENGNINII